MASNSAVISAHLFTLKTEIHFDVPVFAEFLPTHVTDVPQRWRCLFDIVCTVHHPTICI